MLPESAPIWPSVAAPRYQGTRRFIEPGAVVATKFVVSLAVLWSGFRSVSDDDFARVTIAQSFAWHPSLDPSGTSWLPLPFWVYGGAMTLFGPSLATARVTALCLGMAGALAVWFAARAIGMQRPAALVGAILAACIPHSAVYGTATVPDYPTAVLALYASVTLASKRVPIRLVGAAAVCLATLCRYETWPIAAVLVACAIIDAIRDRTNRVAYGVAAALAPSGAIAWMLHGSWQHGDALFFLKRVSAYRRALGGPSLHATTRLLKVPTSIAFGEPEITVLLLLALAAIFAASRRKMRENHPNGPGSAHTWLRPGLAFSSLVAFLTLGNWLDGAPTHHEDRTLLSLWLGMALFAGELTTRLVFGTARAAGVTGAPGTAIAPARVENASVTGDSHSSAFRWITLSVVVTLTLAAAESRSRLVEYEPYVDRSRELCIGHIARERLTPDVKVAIYTEDFGYFAVLSALARPNAWPISRHDPRDKLDHVMQNAEALRAKLDELQAHYVVMPKARRSNLPAASQVIAEACDFLLARLEN
ncbi:MAG TPA: glycosyltransferase family 39 protein [Polyangiaceae bacterium]